MYGALIEPVVAFCKTKPPLVNSTTEFEGNLLLILKISVPALLVTEILPEGSDPLISIWTDCASDAPFCIKIMEPDSGIIRIFLAIYL